VKTHARAELQDVIEAAQCRYDIVTAAVAAAADRNRAMSDGGAASFVRFLIPPVATAAVSSSSIQLHTITSSINSVPTTSANAPTI